MSRHHHKSHHPPDVKQNLVNRLNRIEGQVKAVRRMVEDDTYCDDILNQITSIQSALSGVSTALLENHMKGCVVKQVQDGRLEVIDELLKTVRRQLK